MTYCDENGTIEDCLKYLHAGRTQHRPHTHTACPVCKLRNRHGQWLVWKFMIDVLWCPRCGWKCTGEHWHRWYS